MYSISRTLAPQTDRANSSKKKPRRQGAEEIRAKLFGDVFLLSLVRGEFTGCTWQQVTLRRTTHTTAITGLAGRGRGRRRRSARLSRVLKVSWRRFQPLAIHIEDMTTKQELTARVEAQPLFG